MVNYPPGTQETEETWVRSLGLEDPLEEGMESHSSIFAWRIPCTGEYTFTLLYKSTLAKRASQLKRPVPMQ